MEGSDDMVLTPVEALQQLEVHWKLAPPKGAADLGPGERYMLVLLKLRDEVCPRLKDLSKALKSPEAALAAAIVDVLGPLATGQPLVVGTLFRMITIYGIDRFCSEPEGALDAVLAADARS